MQQPIFRLLRRAEPGDCIGVLTALQKGSSQRRTSPVAAPKVEGVEPLLRNAEALREIVRGRPPEGARLRRFQRRMIVSHRATDALAQPDTFKPLPRFPRTAWGHRTLPSGRIFTVAGRKGRKFTTPSDRPVGSHDCCSVIVLS